VFRRGLACGEKVPEGRMRGSGESNIAITSFGLPLSLTLSP
jgi:hypothetical protein